MKRAGVPVGVGTRFAYDGDIVEIVELHTVDGAPEVLAKDLRSEAVRRFALAELMFSDRARLLSTDLSDEVADARVDTPGVVWSAAPEVARRQARVRAAHVREILTGYRSGSSETARPGEPRSRYRTSVPMGERIAAKAKEIKAGRRTVDRWVKLYRQGGEAALISAKAVQPERGSKNFGLFEQTALEIMIEHTDKSKPNKTFVDSHARANHRHLWQGCGQAALTCYRQPNPPQTRKATPHFRPQHQAEPRHRRAPAKRLRQAAPCASRRIPAHGHHSPRRLCHGSANSAMGRCRPHRRNGLVLTLHHRPEANSGIDEIHRRRRRALPILQAHGGRERLAARRSLAATRRAEVGSR
jgi:hypothetical protein